MKFSKSILACLLVFLCFSAKANILSGNIGWECLGNYEYRFTVDLYVDTTLGSAKLSKEKLQIQTTCGSYNLALKQYSIKNIVPTCDTLRSVCSGTNCYKKIRLVGTSDLSSYVNNGCCEFDLAFQSYVRTQKITTGAASLGFYIDAVLNTCKVACHSSPVWERDAIIVSRIRGDSYELGANLNHKKAQFTFELTPPRSKVGTNTFWSSTRSYTSPLAHRTFLLGKFTGRLALETSASSRSIMAYKLLIKRNGVYLGEITREVYFHVDNLANAAPSTTLQYAVGSRDYSDVSLACGGETTCYTIVAHDRDTVDSIAMALTQNPGYINYSATYSKSNKMTGLYCFAPDTLQAPGIDTFEVTVKDNFCTPNISQRRLYRVLVRQRKHFEPVLNASKKPKCGEFTFTLLKKNTTRTDEDIQWFVDGKEVIHSNYGPRGHSDSLVYNFVNNGSYTVKAVINSCPRREVQRTVQVTGLQEISVLNPEDTTACLSPLTMKLRASGGLKPYSYTMRYGRYGTLVKTDSSVLFVKTYNGLQEDSVIYRISDANGCYVDKQLRIRYKASTETRVDIGQICGKVDSLLNFPKMSGGSWYNDSLLQVQSVDLSQLGFKSFEWFYSNKDTQNCQNTRLTFYYDQKPEALILDSSFTICKITRLSKSLRAIPAGGIWSGENVSSKGGIDVYDFDAGIYPIVYTTTAGNRCTNSDTLQITIEDYEPVINMPGDLSFCLGSKDSFELVATPRGGEWTGLGDSTKNGIKAKASQLSRWSNAYTYEYTDSLGCRAKERSYVYINPLPTVSFEVKTAIVVSGDSIEVVNLAQDSGSSHKWYINDQLVSRSSAKELRVLPSDTGFFVLKLVVTSAASCTDSFEKQFYHDIINGIDPIAVSGLKVYPNPTSNLLFLEGLPTEALHISIRSMDGKEVLNVEGIRPHFIDVSALSKGFYYVQVQTEGGLQNTLFVKQ